MVTSGVRLEEALEIGFPFLLRGEGAVDEAQGDFVLGRRYRHCGAQDNQRHNQDGTFQYALHF